MGWYLKYSNLSKCIFSNLIFCQKRANGQSHRVRDDVAPVILENSSHLASSALMIRTEMGRSGVAAESIMQRRGTLDEVAAIALIF